MKRLLALLMLALFVLPAPVQAQSGLTLTRLEIDLWPEYDQPSMLVIYKGVLPPEVTLPAEVTFRIPSSAGEPHAVAVQQGTSLFTVAHDRQVSGEWALITFTATAPQVQLEYYDPGLAKQGPARHFEFHWPGDYAVESVAIEVQQPAGAEGMSISPNMGSGTARQDGLTYFTTEVGSLEAGETFNITIDYQNESDALSADVLEVRPSAPLSSETAGRVDARAILPWALGILGLLLIVGGGWWYWRSGQDETPAQGRRRRKASREAAESAAPGNGVYCHQCGKRASPGDRFCRSCGARLRLE